MRKAVTGKQPARLTAHPAVRRAHKDHTPYPLSDQTTLPPAERRRAQAVVGVGVLVDGRRPGSSAAGGGTFSRDTAGGGVLLLVRACGCGLLAG